MTWTAFANRHNLDPKIDPISYGMGVAKSIDSLVTSNPKQALKKIKLLKELVKELPN